MYIKAPTILYHATLARTGRLFPGDEEKPIPHPGKDWLDTPAKFGPEPIVANVETIVAANAAAAEAQGEIAALTAESADRLARAESAEQSVADANKALGEEREAHAATKAALTKMTDDFRVADGHAKERLAAAEELPGLKAKLEAMEADLSTSTGQVKALEAALEAAKAEISKMDPDGNGKIGGRVAKAEK